MRHRSETETVDFARFRRSVDHWYGRIFHAIAGADRVTDPFRHTVYGGLAAAGAVLLTSIIIGGVNALARVGNISLLYLLAVIWLAIAFGRSAAIMGAILAFLAYDFFFIPPVHLFTVDNPTEWISLSALLLIGVVVGQLTAEVRSRERAALASQRHIATLYALAQDIAAKSTQAQLLATLTKRLVEVFAPEGVESCALWLPEADHLILRASAHAPPSGANHHLDAPDHQIQAELASREQRITALVDPAGFDAHLTCFAPLMSGGRSVGVLSVTGLPAITGLFARSKTPEPPTLSPTNVTAGQADLFAAFCDQIALALERAALQIAAIHAEALRESDKLKNALLGSVTHDLRTPIAAIQAAASSLRLNDVTWSRPEGQELLATIASSTERLARLVDNLLALSRLEAATTPPKLTLYPINDVIATALDQLDTAGVLIGRTVTVDIVEDPLEAPMDHAAIERVLQNLLENAVKYSPPGSPIAIRAWSEGKQLEVTVTDHGVGIPTAQLEVIFDKFYRLQQPTPWARVTPPQGTGLGLAICAGIIREHDGRIWAESHEGRGATFHFTLPLIAPVVMPQPAVQEIAL